MLDSVPVGRFIIVGLAGSSIVWLTAIFVGGLWVTVVLMLIAFVPIGALSVLLVSTVQAIVPEDLLGRVMGIVTSATTLAMPVGSLMGGAAAVATAPSTVLAAAGATLTVCSLYVLAIPELRRLPRIDGLETPVSEGR